MSAGSGGIASIKRTGTRPALVLPALLVLPPPSDTEKDAGTWPAAGSGWTASSSQATPSHRDNSRDSRSVSNGVENGSGHQGDGDAVGMINISDLEIEGYGPAVSLTQCVELANQLDDGVPSAQRARVIAILRHRIVAHAAAQAHQATTQAVEATAQEIGATQNAGPATHGHETWRRIIRAAISMVALDLVCTRRQVERAIGVTSLMETMPLAQAAALQGQVGADKLALLAKTWNAVPPALRTGAVAGELVQVALDNPTARTERIYKAMLAQMSTAMDDATLEARVARHAAVRVNDLGGGLAELHVIDRAEHIQTIATVAKAAARSARHIGMEGSLGQLAATTLAALAIQALRNQHVPTLYGTDLPLEGFGGRPVRLEMLQTPIRSLLPPTPGMPTIQWSLRDAGILTRPQADTLRDDPIWDGVVEQISLIDQQDPEFLAACEVIADTHDGTPTQRRYTARRDGFHCRCPWCTDTSPPTDLHHTELFADTGQTTIRNLIYVHAACHDIIHHGWTITTDQDGTAHFTDPHGNTHTTYPQGLTPTPAHDATDQN